MTLRHRLAIEPMTAESFAPFGRLVESSAMPGDRRVMTPSQFECDGRTTIHTIWQPCAGRSFSRLERHFGVTQTFFQLSGSPSVVCAAPPTDLDDPSAIPRPEDVRAFLIDIGKGFSFARGTWHSLDRFVLAPPGATFAILNVDPNPRPDRRLPGRDLAPIRESRRRPATDTHRGRHRAATGVRALRWGEVRLFGQRAELEREPLSNVGNHRFAGLARMIRAHRGDQIRVLVR